jgi:signal transduction histidine kinase
MGHESYYYAGMSLTLVADRHPRARRPRSMAAAAAAIYVSFLVFLQLPRPHPAGRLELERLRRQQHLPDRHRRGRRHRRVHQPPPAPRAFDAAWEQERASEELRLVNERVKQSYLEISEKNREIEDAYRSKSQFLDNISHELRTPLTCILTPLEGLLAGNARGELRGVFEDMHSASRQLYDLINDLLDYSKYGNRDQPLQRDPVDLRASSKSTCAPGSPPPASACSPSSGSPPPSPRSPAAAPASSARSSATCSPTPSSSPPSAAASASPSAATSLAVALRVEDSGIGMSPEVLAKLFTPFFQGDATSTRAFEGTGIGLALVKTIVNRHDGDIAVEQQQGQGTTMTVTLPRSPLDPTELAGMAPAPPRRRPASSQPEHPRPASCSSPSPRRRSSSPTTCGAAVAARRRRGRRRAAAPPPTLRPAIPDRRPAARRAPPAARVQRSKHPRHRRPPGDRPPHRPPARPAARHHHRQQRRGGPAEDPRRAPRPRHLRRHDAQDERLPAGRAACAPTPSPSASPSSCSPPAPTATTASAACDAAPATI